MRPMAICPECRPCLERLVGLAVELATPNPEVRRQAYKSARHCLDREFGPGAIPAFIANRLLGIIHHLTGNQDPFAARKTASTLFAARMHRHLAPAYGDDLESLLRLAAVGNALDFFRGEAEVTREMRPRRSSRLRRCLNFAGNWPALPACCSTWRTTPGSSSSIALSYLPCGAGGGKSSTRSRPGLSRTISPWRTLSASGLCESPGAGGGHRGPHRGAGA